MAATATPKSNNGTFELYGVSVAPEEDSPMPSMPSNHYFKQSKDGSMLDTMESSNNINLSQKSPRKEVTLLGRLESLGESIVNETEMATNQTVREPNQDHIATSLASISEKGSQCSDVDMQLVDDSPILQPKLGVESLQNLSGSKPTPQSKTSISKLDNLWKIGQGEEATNPIGSFNVVIKMETHQSYLSGDLLGSLHAEVSKARKVSGANFDEAPSIEHLQFDGTNPHKYNSVEFARKSALGSSHKEAGSSRRCSVFENSIMEENLCEEYSDDGDQVMQPVPGRGATTGQIDSSIAEFNEAEGKAKLEGEKELVSKGSILSIGEEENTPAPPKQIAGKVTTIFKSSFDNLLNGTPKAALKQLPVLASNSFDLSVGEFEVEQVETKPQAVKYQAVKLADINKSLEELEPHLNTKKTPVLLDIPQPSGGWKVNMALRDFQGVDDEGDDQEEPGEPEEYGAEIRPYQHNAVQKTTFDEMFKIGLSCSVISHSKAQKQSQRKPSNTNGSLRFQVSRRRIAGTAYNHGATRSWSPSAHPIQTSAQARLRKIAPGFRRGF
jgi:hypothetical protein